MLCAKVLFFFSFKFWCCYIAIHEYVNCTYNLHKMFIYNIGIPKHKKHLRLLSSGTKLLLPFSLKVFRHKVKDNIFLCWLFHLPQTTCDTCRKATGLASASPESQLSSSEAKSRLTDFSQISAHASGAWLHSHPWSYPLSGIFIVTSLNDTSAPHAREHLRSCLHLTNPCAKRKVLSLTKPKGKIYKTKSLGHYITM